MTEHLLAFPLNVACSAEEAQAISLAVAKIAATNRGDLLATARRAEQQIAGFKLIGFECEHAPSLEAETSQGPVRSIRVCRTENARPLTH